MLVSLQLVVAVASVPLNRTVLVPGVAPKLVPAIVTAVPVVPDAGVSVVIFGVTVKLTPLLATPFTVTTTGPVVAPLGTGTVMLVSLQPVAVAGLPLNVTVPVVPKFVPAIVTDAATGPLVGVTVVICGFVTVNVTLLLA
jgi:hypothetical protein